LTWLKPKILIPLSIAIFCFATQVPILRVALLPAGTGRVLRAMALSVHPAVPPVPGCRCGQRGADRADRNQAQDWE